MRSLIVALFLAGGQQPEGIAVWDTGTPGTEPLTAAAIAARSGWSAVARGERPAEFKGDAILGNGRLLVVVRKKEAAVDVYGAAGIRRARLVLQSANGEAAARLERAALVENARGGACIEAAYRTAQGAELAAKFRLKRGDVSVEAEPGTGAARLRVECPSRVVVLPDFFADDMLIDAAKIPLAAAEVPSENFILHPTGDQDALVMAVFENREQDVRITFEGKDDQRRASGAEIEFDKGRKIWVALLEAKQIWHAFEIKADEKQARPLDWKMPFPGQWRCDFTRADDLTDSWEMLLQEKPDGPYLKPSWMGLGTEQIKADRKRWTTVLGSFKYPAWTDPEGKGHIEPLRHKALSFRGPALIYPMNRLAQTPPETFTVIDVVRNTLGVGPCEYILDVEGQKHQNRGRATCSTRDLLTAIYAKGEQKQKKAEIEKTLSDVLTFVTHIRSRITRYVEFGQKMQAWLAERAKARPELQEPLAELGRLIADIDVRVAARADKIKTPAHVAGMNDDFRKNILDYDGPDALERCKAYAAAVVVVGDNQDELAGECRWVVRAFRQKAGLMMAADPRLAEVGAEIRARTQEALRNPAGHEGARH